MTAKAMTGIGVVHPAAKCVLDAGGLGTGLSRREVEFIDGAVVAHTALIKSPIVLEDVSLPAHANTKRPGERRGNRIRPVANRIGGTVFIARKLECVGGEAEAERFMSPKNWGVLCSGGGVRHGGRLLSGRFCAMTFGARFRPGEFLQGWHTFGGPPSRLSNAIFSGHRYAAGARRFRRRGEKRG